MVKGKGIVVKGREIGNGAPIFLTSEIGCSHEGNFDDARKMMLGAKEAGCDGADMFIASGPDFYHCSRWSEGDRDIREVWRGLSFSPEQWRKLFAYADEIGLILYVTPLDPPSIELARKLKSPMVNINSDDLNNPVHLEQVASLGVPVSMHNINASLAEVEGAVRVLRENGCERIIILHSTQESGDADLLYASANLRVMNTYRAAFSGLGVQVGCVEHTTSDFLIYAVAALEPVLISKHILLEHREGVPDNVISVDLANLKTLVRKVRYVEMALGQGTNQMLVDEKGHPGRDALARRKVLVAARDLPAGHKIEPGDIAVKRPGDQGGLHPWNVRLLYGTETTTALKTDQVLTLNMFRNFPDVDYKFPGPEKRCFKDLEKRRGA